MVTIASCGVYFPFNFFLFHPGVVGNSGLVSLKNIFEKLILTLI